MQENNTRDRCILAKEFLHCLKDTYQLMMEASGKISESSGQVFTDLYHRSKQEIQGEIDKYNTNIEKIKQLNSELTSRINEWYSFIKDEEQLKSPLFPLKLYFKKRNLKNCIQSCNKEISDLVIENRFIKERLTVWQHELEFRAIEQMKQEETYKSYESLIKRKDDIVSELKYLLPSLPGMYPVEISPDNLEDLIERLTPVNT